MTEGFKNCPRCGAPIRLAAVKCRHCGSWLTAEGQQQQTTAETAAHPAAQQQAYAQLTAQPAANGTQQVLANIDGAASRFLENENVQAVSAKLNALSSKNALLLFAGAGALIVLLFLLLPMWSMGKGAGFSGAKCISMGSEAQSTLYPIVPLLFVAGVTFTVVWTFLKKEVNWIYAAVSAVLGIVSLVAIPMIPIAVCGYLVMLLCLAWAALAFLLKGRTLTMD